MEIKSWWKRWPEHVTRMEKTKNAYIIMVGKPECKRPRGNLSLDAKIILE
jgi:hypothetical protein